MEIVAPAGDYSRFQACITGGANSIYLGLKGVGARRKAPNFTLEELKEAIDLAHLKGVKVYLTLNTIFKDTEIESLYTNIKTIYEWGIDAFIVQDIGMIKFLKDNFPKVELHGSTQMTISNHVEAKFYKELGLKRVVLSRELSFEEIKSIKEKCDIDLEIFVSGALCVSYSGNCYMSSFIGSRSGNRGLCAQPCRKMYETCGGNSYFLSPKDQLMDKKEIELLKNIGVESIKVEGRMKSPEYVYETVNYYRNMLDGFYRENQSYKLFNRGYSTGYFYGENKNLMNNNFSFDLGYLLGILKGRELILKDKLKLGDGIVYLDKNYNKVGGEYVSKIFDETNQNLREAQKDKKIFLNKVPKNAYYVHKTYDKELYDKLNKELKEGKRRAPIEILFKIKKGEKVSLALTHNNISVEIFGDVLEEAKNPLVLDKIKEKIEELGESNFFSMKTVIDYDGEAFLSFGYLKELKREAIRVLEKEILESHRRKVKESTFLDKEYQVKNQKPRLFVSVLTKEQYDYVKSLGINEVYYKNPDVIRESNLDKMNKNNRLCGNLCQVLTSDENNLWLDWNSNVINSYAMSVLKDIPKLEGVFVSPELKKEDLLKIDSFQLKKGILVYGKMRAMYIEKALVEEKEEIVNEQKDKFLVIKNDFGNTEIYLKEELNLIPKLEEIEKFGFDYIKIEFTFEDKEKIKEVLDSIETRKGQYKAYNFESGLY